MSSQPRLIRVFLASPGDVPEERAQTRHLIKDDLPALPFIKNQAWLKIVAWEDPTSRAPMPATLSPQKAIALGMDKPSVCDIVVVIFWSRMGTPLDEAQHGLVDGKRPYWSGTEWEYEDALKTSETTGKPVVLVYRRIADVPLNPAWHDFDERVAQMKRVEEFFAEFRDPATGAFLRGYTEYKTPEQFGEMLKNDLLHYIQQILAEPPATEADPADVPVIPTWEGSPFPGLRAFTPDDAPIFFGRGRETDALIKRVSEQRFVAVVGASGCGKSSLVGAGLIPRLLDNAITGSKDWLWRRFTPGEVSDNPFLALAVQLAPLVGTTPRDLADQLIADPDALCTICEQALNGQPDWAKLLLFVDQLEELFTVVKPELCALFVELLNCAAYTDRLRTVVTLRADFYHRCLDHKALEELLREGSFPLGIPSERALFEMITRPAERAGLRYEDDKLPEHILDDTGNEPGALALLAYTLDELYTACDNMLTYGAYNALGSVQGAIGTRAENVFAALPADVQATLPLVFRELVEVDERGTATRQRAPLALFDAGDAAWMLLENFTDARLLTTSGNGAEAVIEVAHEALFRHWERLANWIETAQDDLRLLRQVRAAAAEWDANERSAAFLWPDERLRLVYAMQEQMQPSLDTTTSEFIQPEALRLFESYESASEHQKKSIIDRWREIGPKADGFLMRALSVQDWHAKKYLLDTLQQIASRLMPFLTTALHSEDVYYRKIATRVLYSLQAKDMQLALIPLLEDNDEIVRYYATAALARFGDQLAVQPLIKRLVSNDNIKKIAIVGLGRIGHIDAVHPLIEMLEYPDDTIRSVSAIALGKIGHIDAIGKLVKVAIDDTYLDVKVAAVQALGEIGDSAGLEGIFEVLNWRALDEPDTSRETAALALGKIPDEKALTKLKELLNDEYEGVRKAAAVALHRKNTPDSIAALPDWFGTMEDSDEFDLPDYGLMIFEALDSS